MEFSRASQNRALYSSVFRFAAALLLVALAAAGSTTKLPDIESPPPDQRQQIKILLDAAEHAAHQEQSLPNFICTQTTRRFVDSTGGSGFQPLDVIVERLTYFDHREEYKVVTVNGESSNVLHSDLSGTTTSGEFGTVLKDIFLPDSETDFAWENFYTLRGQRMHVFSYRVKVANSYYHIRVPQMNLDLVIGYHGLIFIDDNKHFVHRITQHADTIPPDYPVQDVSLALDYEYTRIGDSEYLLPLEFELRSRAGTQLIKNDATYDHYRKFAADTSITYDSPTPPDEQKKQ
jgi:hypothetical protein